MADYNAGRGRLTAYDEASQEFRVVDTGYAVRVGGRGGVSGGSRIRG